MIYSITGGNKIRFKGKNGGFLGEKWRFFGEGKLPLFGSKIGQKKSLLYITLFQLRFTIR